MHRGTVSINITSNEEPTNNAPHKVDTIDNTIEFSFKRDGSQQTVILDKSSTVLDLKQKIQELTGLKIENQKILGLTKGNTPLKDDAVLSSLHLKKKQPIVLMTQPSTTPTPSPTEQPQQQVAPAQPTSVFKKISDEVDEITNKIKEVEETLKDGKTKLNPVTGQPRDLKKELLYSDEFLTQKLIQLDGIEGDRAMRKEQIVRIQKLQDWLDKLRSSL